MPTTLRISPSAFALPCLFCDLWERCDKATIAVLDSLFFWHWTSQAFNSQSSLGNLSLLAYPRSCQTFGGGDDSILTPEDQWE